MNPLSLFATHDTDPWPERLSEGAMLLHGFALADESALLAAIDTVTQAAPFRHMTTPGGFEMSVAMSNCGALGWTSDRHGYRYSSSDPLSGNRWPPMPESFTRLARNAAMAAGYAGFAPDACLINRYAPGARLTLHQDKDEQDFTQPIVSVSLGIPATFLLGGLKRSDKALKVSLTHGDVVVWGGPDRLRYHGVLALRENRHPLVGRYRINLTFRRAAK